MNIGQIEAKLTEAESTTSLETRDNILEAFIDLLAHNEAFDHYSYHIRDEFERCVRDGQKTPKEASKKIHYWLTQAHTFHNSR